MELNVPYAIMEILVAIFAVFGNGLVIVVFFRERRLRRRTNFYIVSLAVADLMFGLFGIPIAILVKIIKQSNGVTECIVKQIVQISVGVPQNCYTCLFMTSILLVFCTVSIFSLVLISIDRFIVS